jgi:hypothetical protein
VSDPWEDEGFGGDDDWAGDQSLEADVEDDELDEAELEDEAEDTLADEEE